MLVQVKVRNLPTIQRVVNETQPVKVSGSGRVIPGTIINISTEVQGVLKQFHQS